MRTSALTFTVLFTLVLFGSATAQEPEARKAPAPVKPHLVLPPKQTPQVQLPFRLPFRERLQRPLFPSVTTNGECAIPLKEFPPAQGPVAGRVIIPQEGIDEGFVNAPPIPVCGQNAVVVPSLPAAPRLPVAPRIPARPQFPQTPRR